MLGLVPVGQRGSEERPARGLLAGMRIRKKLIFLHTAFSVALTTVLLVALWPAIEQVVARAEASEADLAIWRAIETGEARVVLRDGLVVAERGDARSLGLSERLATQATEARGEPVPLPPERGRTSRVAAAEPGVFVLGRATIPEARRAVVGVYALLVVSMLLIYALIAAALEVFVLPQHVYGPIRRMLSADTAVQRGDEGSELIPDELIPRDELGEIMRSRNASVRALREHERALADALERLEEVATDLKRKNHLLETAQRNLEGADRLASLGMMSAGIAHELNTPLSVAKGLTEKLNASGGRGLNEAEAALLGRVVGRLERLSESLLDFARAREPETRPTRLIEILDEAATLVRLDRGAVDVAIHCDADPGLMIEVDGDRMVQVFVNLIRNAVDAIKGGPVVPGVTPDGEGGVGEVRVGASALSRDGGRWVTVRIVDDGPGIDPDVLPSLFEPFVSTRLDHQGTGLGLAVAEGIVREHGGTVIARNRTDRRGAVFEVMLPAGPSERAARAGETSPEEARHE